MLQPSRCATKDYFKDDLALSQAYFVMLKGVICDVLI